MFTETKSPELRLRALRNDLDLQRTQLQGEHSLTVDDRRRADALAGVVQNLDMALRSLDLLAPSEEGPPPLSIHLRDGSYITANNEVSADLRLDIAASSIISMDLFRVAGDTRVYVASVRTDPGAQLGADPRRLGVIGQDTAGQKTRGRLELAPVTETQMTINLTLDQPLVGLPGGSPIVLAARWQHSAFHALTIEVDQEQDVPDLPQFIWNGQMVDVDSCFEVAGFEMSRIGAHGAIPKPPTGWDEAQLHGLMVPVRQGITGSA